MGSSVLDRPVTLTASHHAPAQARRQVAGACKGLPSDMVEIAVLLVSELVTNAIVHGNGVVKLRVLRAQRRLRVEVGDEGRDTPQPVASPHLDDESGRGLHIVDALASDWGCEPDTGTGGKLVWFELARREPRS